MSTNRALANEAIAQGSPERLLSTMRRAAEYANKAGRSLPSLESDDAYRCCINGVHREMRNLASGFQFHKRSALTAGAEYLLELSCNPGAVIPRNAVLLAMSKARNHQMERAERFAREGWAHEMLEELDQAALYAWPGEEACPSLPDELYRSACLCCSECLIKCAEEHKARAVYSLSEAWSERLARRQAAEIQKIAIQPQDGCARISLLINLPDDTGSAS